MSLTRRAGLVFLCALAYLGWLAASRFVLTLNDEGIYLDGGLRVLHGQMPYRDFFSLTGPGTFVLEAASMRVFGATLAAGRMPVVFDIAILTACLFWLVSQVKQWVEGPTGGSIRVLHIPCFCDAGRHGGGRQSSVGFERVGRTGRDLDHRRSR